MSPQLAFPDARDDFVDIGLTIIWDVRVSVYVHGKRDVLTVLVAVVGDQKEVGGQILPSQTVRLHMLDGGNRTDQKPSEDLLLVPSGVFDHEGAFTACRCRQKHCQIHYLGKDSLFVRVLRLDGHKGFKEVLAFEIQIAVMVKDPDTAVGCLLAELKLRPDRKECRLGVNAVYDLELLERQPGKMLLPAFGEEVCQTLVRVGIKVV